MAHPRPAPPVLRTQLDAWLQHAQRHLPWPSAAKKRARVRTFSRAVAGDEVRPAHLVKTKGAIVNNGSVVGEVGFPNFSIYSATKGAVHALTRAVAMEFIPQGVRVNPGRAWTHRDRNGGTGVRGIDGLRARARESVPVGAPGQVEDVAAAVL